MISRYEAYMDGTSLSSIHPNLLILDIGHEVSSFSVSAESIAKRDGLMVLARKRAKTVVTISFMLRIYDIAERQRVLQQIQRWAKGSVLETNDRPGQELYVSCDEFPMIGSARDWLEELTMSFTTYEKPYWMEKTYASVSLTAGTSGSGSLYVPGNAGETFVEVTATPSSSMANITLTVGNTSMTLTGVSATSSQPITIRYDNQNILHIKRGTTSVLDKRTGSDDLLAECGTPVSVSFSSSVSCTVVFRAKGVWL